MVEGLGQDAAGAPDLSAAVGSAAAVGERLEARLDDILGLLADAYRAEIPEYAALDPEQMAATVLPISRGIAVAFIRALREEHEPRLADVSGLDRIGVDRVGMGMPLEPMLHAFRVFGRVVWVELARETAVTDVELLADMGARWMDWIDRASSAAATAYLRASNDLVRRLDARRGAMLEALLEATSAADAVAVATEFQTSLAPTYTPVVLAGHDVAIRIDSLLSAVVDGTIAGVRPSGVWLLVPDRASDVDALRTIGRADLAVHGVPAAPGVELTRSAQEAQLLLATAQARGRTGVVGPDDLVLERLVAGEGAVERWLDDQLACLADADRTGNIVETLRTFLASGSIPDTAAAVHAHPNTVTYRLGRVREICGLDPRVPADAAVLHLALLRAT